MPAFTAKDVSHIATLASIPVTHKEAEELAKGFSSTIAVVDTLASVDVSRVQPTSQVTDKTNELREDVIDEGRMFTQEEALANAPKTYNGYFVVPRVLTKG